MIYAVCDTCKAQVPYKSHQHKTMEIPEYYPHGMCVGVKKRDFCDKCHNVLLKYIRQGFDNLKATPNKIDKTNDNF
jgi:hypothetical protein